MRECPPEDCDSMCKAQRPPFACCGGCPAQCYCRLESEVDLEATLSAREEAIFYEDDIYGDVGGVPDVSGEEGEA